jgi:endoribonuclease Dicer
LGDAILDWLVTRYLFEKFPGAEPSDLSEMRVICVNNSSFARLAVELNLHESVLHSSTVLQSDFDEFLKWYHTGDNKNIPPNELTFDAPKVLGDLFESVCGAVFVDAGFDAEKLWEVMSPVITSFIDKHCDPERIRRNPVRQFYEVIQSAGLTTDDIDLRVTETYTESTCDVYVKKQLLGKARGNTPATAKRLACLNCMDKAFIMLHEFQEKQKEAEAEKKVETEK